MKKLLLYLITSKISYDQFFFNGLSPYFEIGQQNDAHEFLITLVNKMEEETDTKNKVFEGSIKQKCICQICDYVSTRTESFNCLSITCSGNTLEDMLSKTFESEEVDSR